MRERVDGRFVRAPFSADAAWVGLAARISRRRFLGAAAATAFLAACSSGGSDGGEALAPPPSLSSDPFTLGVASGDPTDDGVVLWTRLAPDPLAGGGMPDEDVDVVWELGTDEDLKQTVAQGVASAIPELGHSVHVDASGLDADRPYWYRFRVGDFETPVARTRTMPAASASPGRMRMGQVSCQRFDPVFFVAYRDLAATEDLDLVVHCGDYIYEKSSVADDASGTSVRDDPLPEAIDLVGYRNRYALTKSDEHLLAAHAIAPWLVTWDDHEVENNYTSDSPEIGSETPGREEFLARRAAAYQAWWEHTPVRLDAPSGPDLRIYRPASFGDLARFLVLDTRQYRSPQVCGDTEAGLDVGPRCPESFEPEFTALGDEQEGWVADQLAGSDAIWNVIVQQVVMQQWRFAPGNTIWNLDQWDGYPAARDRFFETLRASGASNPVVLSGDVHSSWVGSLAADFDDPASEILATEFVATAISSEPSGALTAVTDVVLDNSPHIAWAETTKRGWMLHDVTRDAWRTNVRLVFDPTMEDSQVETESSWVVPAGGTLSEA